MAIDTTTVSPKPEHKRATLHFVRHAQGFHNLGVEFHNLHDPRLTPTGEEQVVALRDSLGPEFLSKIHLVTASPLSRTVHTAAIAFKPILRQIDPEAEKDEIPTFNSQCKSDILAVPDAQEISDFPCDTGIDPDVLAKECKIHKWPLDMSLVRPGWNHKTMTNRWSPRNPMIEARARDTRKLLRTKVQELRKQGIEAPQIVMVAHGGLLHYLTQDWEDAFTTYGTGWKNCEIRSYVFADELDDERERRRYQNGQKDEAFLVETKLSRFKRGKTTPMPGRAEQKELFWQTMAGWENQHLQTPMILEREWQQELGQGKHQTIEQDDIADLQPNGVGEKGQKKRRESCCSLEGFAPAVRAVA